MDIMGIESAHIGGGYIRAVVTGQSEPEFYLFKINAMNKAMPVKETETGYVLMRNNAGTPEEVAEHLKSKYNLEIKAWDYA